MLSFLFTPSALEVSFFEIFHVWKIEVIFLNRRVFCFFSFINDCFSFSKNIVIWPTFLVAVAAFSSFKQGKGFEKCLAENCVPLAVSYWLRIFCIFFSSDGEGRYRLFSTLVNSLSSGHFVYCMSFIVNLTGLKTFENEESLC